MAPVVPPTARRACAALLVAALVALPGSVQDELATPPEVDGSTPCEAPAAACVWDDPRDDSPGLITYPTAGDYILSQLKPFLDRDTYALLEDVLGGRNTPPAPLPPRPQEVGFDVEARAKIKAHVSPAHAHVGPAHAHVGPAGAHAHAQGNVSLVGHGGAEDHEQVPCSDPRGCPDLVVDPAMLAVGMMSEQTFAPDDCAVVEGTTEPGTRRLLRFTFTTPNVGDGDLVIGVPSDHPEWFEWGQCHNHWHFRDHAQYRLWTPEGYVRWLDARSSEPEKTSEEVLDGDPGLRDEMVAGHKQGFCAIDVRPYTFSDPPRYNSCADNQGISRGWADEYSFALDGQWVDITAVSPGWYVLEGEANPGRLYQEIDYANNAAAIPVFVPPT